MLDETLLANGLSVIESFVEKLQKLYQLRTAVHGSGPFFWAQSFQHDDCSIKIHENDGMNRHERYRIARQSRKQMEKRLDAVEVSSYRSMSSCIA